MSDLSATECCDCVQFESLVRESQAGLRAFIRALGVDGAWVDDVAQETFLIAYRQRGGFRRRLQNPARCGKRKQRGIRSYAQVRRSRSPAVLSLLRNAFLRPIAAALAMALLAIAGTIWVHAATTLRGEAVCMACALNAGDEHFPAQRACFKNISRSLAAGRGGWLRCSSVTDLLPNMLPCRASPSTPPRTQSRSDLFLKHALKLTGSTSIDFFEHNAVVDGAVNGVLFCGSPRPVAARGYAESEHGRVRFNASTFTILGALPKGTESSQSESLGAKIDVYIQREMQRRHVPGLSLAILKNGKTLATKGYGLANVELNAPATPETVYQMASITKTFTATAVMQLVENRKIQLQDRINSLLVGLPSAWSNVTVWHLLTHTSGIKSYTQLAGFMENPGRTFTHSEVIALVSPLPLEFSPGNRYEYSNTGYYALGMLIEKISGKFYGDYLQEHIFGPLEMRHTRYNDPSAIIARRANGYTLEGDAIANAPSVNPSQPFSAGALLTSVSDLAKWDAALYTDKILKQSTLDQMWQPARFNNGSFSNYGFGWGSWTRQGRRHIQHNGGILGFSSHIRRDLDAQLTIIVLANLSGRGIIAEEIAEGIARLHENQQL